ncbi:MAG: hypothetical protein ING31_10420 [Burkholderiales bacterium]|nr:hypothetical protein [Burkholderiales bacterium]
MEQQPQAFAQPSVPDWLTPAATSHSVATATTLDPAEHRRATRALLDTAFASMFERVLTEMTKGRSLNSIVREDLRDIEYDAFWRWIKRDPQRYKRYKEAKELRTEWWAGRIVEIAEAEDSVEDVARSKLKIDTYKWLMGADNRKQYGDVKQLEVTQSISITAALEQARSRLLTDVTTVDIVDDGVDTPRIEHSSDD